MKEFDYMNAVEEAITEQEFEVAELEAEISYLESSKNKSEGTFKMIAECKAQLAEAIENLTSSRKYAESIRAYC